jgi:P pilus assembly chaperone PapD
MRVEGKAMSARSNIIRAAGPALWALAMLAPSPAHAELIVSQLIVEFKPGGSRTADVEIFNNSDERSYVVVEPRELLEPGTSHEKPFATPDPARLGLLVSPARFILEPQQRRTLRIAAIGPAAQTERVYRVTVKPVSGEIKGSESGLKLLVGYDLLVLVRPPAVRSTIRSTRNGLELILSNDGNSSVELAEGKQCDPSGKSCDALPAKRLYAGAAWKQQLKQGTVGEYHVRSAEGWSILKF